jgi:hypothetical protein
MTISSSLCRTGPSAPSGRTGATSVEGGSFHRDLHRNVRNFGMWTRRWIRGMWNRSRSVIYSSSSLFHARVGQICMSMSRAGICSDTREGAHGRSTDFVSDRNGGSSHRPSRSRVNIEKEGWDARATKSGSHGAYGERTMWMPRSSGILHICLATLRALRVVPASFTARSRVRFLHCGEQYRHIPLDALPDEWL